MIIDKITLITYFIKTHYEIKYIRDITSVYIFRHLKFPEMEKRMNRKLKIKFIVNEACHQITINHKDLSVEIITEQILTDGEKEMISRAISRYYPEN